MYAIVLLPLLSLLRDTFRGRAVPQLEHLALRHQLATLRHLRRVLVEYVLLSKRAPWLQDFQTEILQFPHGRHDDQVDSLSQFLSWVLRPKRLRSRIRWL